MLEINEPLKQELNQYIAEIKTLYQVPGISVAITQQDKIIYQHTLGYSNLENHSKIDEKTLFPIGSLTKSFTAAAIGILVDEGKLDLDTPICNYLPDFEMHDPNATKEITMRDILSHQTGLSKHLYWWFNSDLSRKELVSKIKFLEPLNSHRSKWEYTNIMYIFAGYLIEHIEGMPWELFLIEKILKPLKMYDTFPTPNEIGCLHRLATPYGLIDETNCALELPTLSSVAPAGSMVSTIEDLAKWARFNLQSYQSEPAILSANYLSEMQRKQVNASIGLWHFNAVKDEGYGLGWFVETFKNEKLVYHSGNIDGFSSQLSFIPDKNISIIILTNSHNNFISYGLTYYLIDQVLGKGKGKWGDEIYKHMEQLKKLTSKMKMVSLEDEVKLKKENHTYNHLEGTFFNEGYGQLLITQKEHLSLTLNQRVYELLHFMGNIFALNHKEYGLQLPVHFHTKNNEVTSVSIPFGLHPNLKEIVFKKSLNL